MRKWRGGHVYIRWFVSWLILVVNARKEAKVDCCYKTMFFHSRNTIVLFRWYTL